ncbi:MAG: hypothetical protein HY293_19780, partial [Planctomycetes bacterium]|nr:hypothetical protein [Planctomycetota bacterium]
MKRHARVWKWVLGLAGGMALAIGILVGDAYRKAGAVFERHEADVSRVLAEVRERDFVRPPLFGEGIPGNAFDDYRSALQNLKGPPTVGGSEIRLLRNGLSRRIADPGDEIMSPTSLSWPRVYAYLAGLSYLSQAAAQAHRRGNDHHAVEMVVLLFGAAQDTIGRGVPELASL